VEEEEEEEEEEQYPPLDPVLAKSACPTSFQQQYTNQRSLLAMSPKQKECYDLLLLLKTATKYISQRKHSLL
jgi:hypothetical protein